ncbi:serine/threonine-protein kinase ATM isoform X2 [Sitodiplosis mosellana]|uniref:serine/threonine-protein kinase ATM isoform X2 n=1 Tax=Sitodiplosis mosellana TaxID=263140 RepID=UPI00244407E1|nr:serine/threonine-protein kinase ATM isoform X2 [Sitodiplosis mosellana]
MSSMSALLMQIKQIVLIDLKSDKATVRTKCLDEFHNIFDSRSKDLCAILRANNNNRSDDDDHETFTWSELFSGLHEALKDQCMRIDATQNKKSLIAKNNAYKEALRKCINAANEHVPNVSYARICNAAFECFDIPSISIYFDELYLQIVWKHILSAKHSLSEIRVADWSSLLSHIFKLYDQRNSQIKKIEILQCIPLILRKGAKYRYLVSEMHQYLPNVIRIVNDGQLQNQPNSQKQILQIVYELIRNLAVNQRLSVIGFTESVLEKLLKFYQFSMDPDFKVNLLKIMHISIVVHSPEPNSFESSLNEMSDQSDDLFKSNVAEDAQLWHKHLRNMLSIVEREITESRKRSHRLNPIPKICPIFVEMSAKLCSVVYWKEDVWNSSNDEQQQKRRRHSMRLERIFELIEYEPSKFCWRWFAILSQLLVDFPHLLQAEDYQSLLKLLVDFKPTIQHALHMSHFIHIVDVMLGKEQELKSTSEYVRESFCTEHWHKIMDLSFKQAATDKIQLENLDLMRILVENKVIVSHDFIKEVISEVTKMSHIKKSHQSVNLLISIFRNVNIDMIESGSTLKITVIKWLSAKVKLSELKKVIESNGTIDKQLISELYVLCVLSRQENTNKRSYKMEKANVPEDADVLEDVEVSEDADVLEHKMFIADMVQNLQYRMLSKLIVSDNLQCTKKDEPHSIEVLPEKKNDVKAFINETIFGELENAIHDESSNDNVNSTNETSLENFHSVSTSFVTYVNILNALVGYESIDSENFYKYLSKRVFLKVGQLNSIVSNFSSSFNIDRNPNDVNEVVEGLLSIWHDKYHAIIAENMFIVANNVSIIQWLTEQLKPSRREESLVLTPLRTIGQLGFEERIHLKCLTLLAQFSAYDNENDDESETHVFEAISEYEFNYKRNEDLFILFQLIKIILNQRHPSETLTEWAFSEMKEICMRLTSHHGYMEMVVENIPALIKCVKPYTDLHDDLINLLSSFLKQIKSKKYGPHISIKIIKSAHYFAQEFFYIEDGFDIIVFLHRFLQSKYLTIQFATVACLTDIFNKNWLIYQEDEVNCLAIQEFHTKLVEKLNIDELSVEDVNDIDRKTCIVSTRLQLYCSIIGACYPLRRRTWFYLIAFCGQHLKMNEGKTVDIVAKLCNDVFHTTPSVLLSDLFPHLVSLWIDNDYHLTRFPAKLTLSETHNDFIVEYIDTITLRILLYKSEFIPELLKMTESTSLSELLSLPVLIKCLAHLTSVQVSQSASRENKAKAVNMLKILRKEKPRIEDYFDSHALEIIEELLNNMWDVDKFREYFDTEVEYVTDEQSIDHKVFLKSLEYIQQKAMNHSNIVHHYCEMSPRKVVNMLYSLKLLWQKSVCDELKHSQMLRICVFIDIIVDFLIENATKPNQSSIIGFFVRDFVYFIGNTISSDCSDKLKLATCKYFYKFCDKLLPACAEYLQNHLNYIVSILMPITKSKSPPKICEAGMHLLRFLIVEQRDVLKTAIGQLDSFPKLEEFNELSQIQSDVKYNGKTFTLLDEIEYFLSVDKRKIEGLLSLKEHLSNKKNELEDIYKMLYDTRGFSEDCERSPIHRLISALLTQIVQNVDSEKSVIAAKCLGELGPSDLGSIALKFDTQLQTYKICKTFEDAVSNLCEHALEKLNGIFIHSDATVLQTAAEACKHLLQSQKAVSFLDKYPLLKVFETGAVTELPLHQSDQQQLDFEKLFSDNAFRKAHSFWVKSLAIELFTLFSGDPLAQVAAKQTQFSTVMIPLLIKALLTTKNAGHKQTLNTAINRFFAKTFERLTATGEIVANETQSSTPVYLNKVSIKLMLNVAECIRVHNQTIFSSTPGAQLKLNYLHIAKAALFCEAYFTAILYGELASYEKHEGTKQAEIQSIMKNSYQSIGETDAVSAFLDPITQKMEYLELNGCWNEILIGIDAQTNDFTQNSRYLMGAGLYSLSNKLAQGNDTPNYECAWRLADWGIVEGSSENANQKEVIDANGFDKYHYFALKSLQQKDQIGANLNVKRAFEAVIKMFKQSSYECTKNIYKNLMMLHLLLQIEEFGYVQFPGTDDPNHGPEFVINKWKNQDRIASCGFKYREPILAQRVTLLESAGVRAKRKFESVCKFGDGIQQMILNLVAECREEDFLNLGERYSAALHKKALNREMKARAFIEDAQLNWKRGESEMAQLLIANVIKQEFPSLTRAKAFGIMGEYLAEARLEDTKTIIKSYFKESSRFSEGCRKVSDQIKPDSPYYVPPEERERLHLENMKRNHSAIAKYADREYQQIAAYKNSAEFEKKVTNIKRNQEILAEMTKAKSLTKDEHRSVQQVQKFVSLDESDVESTNADYKHYLHTAVLHYIDSLMLESNTEMNSSAMFRLFSLWSSNSSDADILKDIEENHKRIPTYKFIPLMTQITTHLSTDGMKKTIEDIILRCALEHPHHVLPKVLALVNAFKDDEFIHDAKNRSSISSSPRIDAAFKLLQVMKGRRELRDIIFQMELMFENLIRLANTDLKDKKEFPSNDPIRKIRDLNLVHCPTVNLPVSISGDYTKTRVGIHRWKTTFTQPGGINAPKRIECIGSNGIQYSQLLKGTDDLRQDAVMQQVFTIMNDMLSQSRVTKKDRLHVRTYIIVPLSQRSGILEWCENTMPLTDYLVGSSSRKGAHERFRPQDWSPKVCRKQMSQITLRNSKLDKIHENYKTICDNIKPVFHHFFLEHFNNPGVWFERRMAYAHSLATTSMIGYILGIGDRHVSNILIDKTTAELIHIDFGIAFEQGKCLPTPELIPFRLTRDLVDALGPSGVEGVYRKSCEKTMEVLRKNKSTILTIVEVLLHDPLYAWALTSNQASKRQQTDIQINEEDQDINTMAERALWRLEEKLDGKHVSRSEGISVKRHVEILFKEAMNDKLLCRLFVGWQPYL